MIAEVTGGRGLTRGMGGDIPSTIKKKTVVVAAVIGAAVGWGEKDDLFLYVFIVLASTNSSTSSFPYPPASPHPLSKTNLGRCIDVSPAINQLLDDVRATSVSSNAKTCLAVL